MILTMNPNLNEFKENYDSMNDVLMNLYMIYKKNDFMI